MLSPSAPHLPADPPATTPALSTAPLALTPHGVGGRRGAPTGGGRALLGDLWPQHPQVGVVAVVMNRLQGSLELTWARVVAWPPGLRPGPNATRGRPEPGDPGPGTATWSWDSHQLPECGRLTMTGGDQVSSGHTFGSPVAGARMQPLETGGDQVSSGRTFGSPDGCWPTLANALESLGTAEPGARADTGTEN